MRSPRICFLTCKNTVVSVFSRYVELHAPGAISEAFSHAQREKSDREPERPIRSGYGYAPADQKARFLTSFVAHFVAHFV